MTRERNGKAIQRDWIVTYTITRYQRITARSEEQAERKLRASESHLRQITIISIEEE